MSSAVTCLASSPASAAFGPCGPWDCKDDVNPERQPALRTPIIQENPPMDLRSLPKIELHSHLDCAISFDAVHAIDPTITRDLYETRFVAPRDCGSLAEYLTYTFNYRKLLQTEAALRIAVQDVFAQMQQENVIYAELRFAPLIHTEGELAAEEVVRTVADEVSTQISITGIEASIILCTLRDYTSRSEEHTSELQSRENIVCRL